MKRLSSSQLRKVLSGLVAGQPYREIAEQVQINKSTVGRVMSAATQSGKGVKALLELDDNELINAVYPPEPGSREEPDWMAIHKQLQRKMSRCVCSLIGIQPRQQKRPTTTRPFVVVTTNGGVITAFSPSAVMSSACPANAWRLILPAICLSG